MYKCLGPTALLFFSSCLKSVLSTTLLFFVDVRENVFCLHVLGAKFIFLGVGLHVFNPGFCYYLWVLAWDGNLMDGTIMYMAVRWA